MTNTVVFTKDLQAATFEVAASQFLLPGETLVGATIGTASPTTAPPLVLALLVYTDTSVSLSATGGTSGTSYGAVLTCTASSARVFDVTVATLVQQDLAVPYQTQSPGAFQNLVGALEAGDSAIGKALFVVDNATQGINSGYVTWELLDNTGAVYAEGNAYSYLVSPDSFQTVVEAEAVVNVPTTVAPTLSHQFYQIRWALHLNSQVAQHSYENLEVLGNTSVPVGPSDGVELSGDIAQLQLVLDRAYAEVAFAAYNGNNPITAFTPSVQPKRTAGGWLYTAQFDTTDTAVWKPGLDPYQVMWRYKDTNTLSYQREAGHLFVLQPSMLSAIKDVQSSIMKASTTIDGNRDTIFDPVTVMTWLRRGRDMFNSAGGVITDFTMTNATGQVREFWLKYAEVDALRAQYLAEGEKAFNFSGQAISLDVDRTQFYETLAGNILASVQDSVATLKKNLSIKGINGGDGNVLGALGGNSPGAMGAVGVGYNAVSPNYPWVNPTRRF